MTQITDSKSYKNKRKMKAECKIMEQEYFNQFKDWYNSEKAMLKGKFGDCDTVNELMERR